MADKEATVFIIDVGASMRRTHHNRQQSDLDWSLQYVWDKITNIVSTGRKTLFVGVIALGTNETNNDMGAEEGYAHISTLQTLQPMGMPDLRRLTDSLAHHQSPSSSSSLSHDADALSAVILAVDMLTKHCRQLKYTKRIFLLTNATSPIDAADLSDVTSQIQTHNITLTVLGVDFDDPTYGFTEPSKPTLKRRNETLLRKLVENSGGDPETCFGTMAEAIEGLDTPYVKPVRPTPTYKGTLCLGDPNNYDTAISIDVERYFKVMVKRPPTASNFVVRLGDDDEDGEDAGGGGGVKREKEEGKASISSGAGVGEAGEGGESQLYKTEVSRTYHVVDPTGEAESIEVPRDELAKGYLYGRTAVHIAESDENITKLETEAGYQILGFIPSENIERYTILDNTSIIIAQRGNDKAAFALSSLIHALVEIDSCIIARLVKKDMAEPQLTLLTPQVTADHECLIENILPFAEDVRQYRFPPVDKVVTVSGKHVSSHRNLPSKDLMSAMSDFVDSMSLMDEEGEDRLPIQDTYSPVNYAVERAVRFRAVHPDQEIPPLPSKMLTCSQPPPELVERSKNSLATLIKAADVKKVPPKVKGRTRYRNRDDEKPLSGLDVESLFNEGDQQSGPQSDGTRRRKDISADNAIPEFKQILDASDSNDVVARAVSQFEVIIRDRIRTSFGSKEYDRVIEELGVMRESVINFEFPLLYNTVVKPLKKDLFAEELGGNRKELWYRIRKAKLGLITTEEAEVSDAAGKEEADQFLQGK